MSRDTRNGGAALAPVALFIYRRPEHTRRLIMSLKRCSGFAGSRIYVFADGPKNRGEADAVMEARHTARALLGDRGTFVERETNLGLDEAIVGGVTTLVREYGSVVVLEDDLIVSPGFLDFVNDGLRRYAHEAAVMQVSGYMYDVPELARRDDALFLPFTNSWGWATWRRAWDEFDPKASGWRELLRNKQERRRFDLDDHFPYAKMLQRQMARPVPAWDIRWYYTVFANAGLVLYPPRTLVANAGLDGSGTHGRLSHRATAEDTPPDRGAFHLPAAVAVSPARPAVVRAIRAFNVVTSRERLIGLTMLLIRRVWPAPPR